jgi:hypothetical protein
MVVWGDCGAYGFKPGRGDGFLRMIKICRIPSFRWEVRFYGMLKIC